MNDISCNSGTFCRFIMYMLQIPCATSILKLIAHALLPTVEPILLLIAKFLNYLLFYKCLSDLFLRFQHFIFLPGH